jgi:hypothetical protein
LLIANAQRRDIGAYTGSVTPRGSGPCSAGRLDGVTFVSRERTSTDTTRRRAGPAAPARDRRLPRWRRWGKCLRSAETNLCRQKQRLRYLPPMLINLGKCSRQAWLLRLIVAFIVGGAVAGCGSSTSSSSGSSAASGHRSRAAPSDSTQAATSFWRQQVSAKYQGPVATGDGRGCALASKTRWVCTAYVRKSDRNVDVFGAVTASGGVMAAEFHLSRGDEITNWFTQTGGGCQTDSCKGTRLKSGS